MNLADLTAWFTDPAQWSGADGIPNRLTQHLIYTAITLAVGLLIAIPLGAWVGHTGRLRWLVTGANALRAVPSLGLLFAVSMLVGPLIQSDLAFVIPSIVVLVLLAVPPLLSGVYAGIDSVDPAARDAARGMGMTGWQVLTRVELPCALPLALSGFAARRCRSSRRRRSPPPSASAASAATSSTAWPRATTCRWSAAPSSSPPSRSSPTCSSPRWRGMPCRRESPGGPRVLPVHAARAPTRRRPDTQP